MQESTEPTKLPSTVIIVIVVVVALSFVAILGANYMLGHPEIPGNTDLAMYLMLMGAIGLFISIYVLWQLRKRIMHTKIQNPPIVTVVECKACGYKKTRAFQRGDYIFKEGEPCDKCKGKTLITAIYREVKDKEKESYS